MKMIRVVFILLFIFPFIGSCHRNPTGPEPIPQDKIVFASLSSETRFWDLFSINADGSEKTRLTNNFSESTHGFIYDGRGYITPFCSPGGTKIAVAKSVHREGFDIYVMNSDGTGLTLIGDGLSSNGFLDWSPDGTQLAFTSDRDGNREIYTMNIDGSELTRLTFNEIHDDIIPDWSPDGSKIVYISGENTGVFGAVFVMNRDGTDKRLLTDHQDYCNSPRWSPNGSKILYMHGGVLYDSEICIIDVDGTNQIQLTDNDYQDSGFSWFPDGSKVIFISDRDGNRDVYTVNADGTNERILTDRSRRICYASWSPDGSKIVLVDTYDMNLLAIYPPHDIFTVNPDGSGIKNLTHDANNNRMPRWLNNPYH